MHDARGDASAIRLEARPEGLTLEAARTALIVVDMQNAFVNPGGLLDQAGIDISAAPSTVEAARRAIAAARALGIGVVYLTIGYPADLSTAGGPHSPNPRKELALRLMEARPDLRGRLLIWETWDAAIADQVRPQPGDLVVSKQRYSGFAGTPLDQVLRSRDIRHLMFIGVATNVCVESTLRDAYFLEYWPVLIEDATMQAGPAVCQQATVFNVEHFFGWVTTSHALADAAAGAGLAAPAHRAAT
ncbi:MAG: cysteine hydrolase family protein [Candidatus Rokuibacteriota bacterium]